ncbi:MAG: fibrobacter succinogenes major paralogous domain-containing protein [Bacteroidia bacterium]|nr:fibrobacter succinogenes major paralogous domain-containing protein [Bacteroidia bacterium]
MINKSLLMTVAILIVAMSLAAQETGTFKDNRDGKKYKTVKIGTQTWMAENLAYKAESGCWAYSDNEDNVATYGYLYDWKTAKIACPEGWHLPTNEEWSTLCDYLGGEKIAGGKMKETGTAHWNNPNTEATNSSGFTALPGGTYHDKKALTNIGNFGGWWSSTEYDINSAWFQHIFYNYSGLYRSRHDLNTLLLFQGYSVRCIKDK